MGALFAQEGTQLSQVTHITGSTDTPLTMSSTEIAEATGKNHADVMRDIRKLLKELDEGGISKFADTYQNQQNRQHYPCFRLPRRETDVLLTGYSIPLRAKVIDRWRELEAQVVKPAFAIPTSFAAALRLAGELEEQRAVLTHQVETQGLKIAEDAPKVGVYHQIADSTGLIGFQKFCTDLKLNQKEVKHWLKDIGWLRANQYVVNPPPTAFAVDGGYCDTTYFTTTSGRVKQTLWFTGKAATYVAEKAPDYIRKKVRKSRKKAA